MVGHRFVEALRARDTDGAWRVVVLGEEPDAAYDRVGLSSYVGAWDRRCLRSPATTTPETTASTCGSGRGDPQSTGRPSESRRRRVGRAYDALVLATGRMPFVPPVPGHDLPGCHVYRTLDDLDAIRADAAGARWPATWTRVGVVVGGGLLGLEAANALRLLGMTPARRRDRAPADASAARRGRRGAAAPVLELWASPCTSARHGGHRSRRRRQCGSTLSDGTVIDAGAAWCSPPASARATNWPAPPASRSLSAAAWPAI